MRRASVWFVLAALVAVSPALAGTFTKTDRCPFDTFIVTHPPGYDGTGGEITVPVCLAPDTPGFILPALQQAIDTWNGFAAVAPNCQGCLIIEEMTPSNEPFVLASGLLHELGHCAFGLGHPNHQATSFTASRRDCPAPPDPLPPVAFDEGDDGVAGSSDDLVFPLPGTRILHWFRTADNNPATIDATIIDQDTYTRRRLDLPMGHRWPANANRVVADELLGFPNTQAVMYGGLARSATITGLSADDIATAEYGFSGLDTDANTPDDYTVTLTLVPDCVDAVIEVRYRSFANEPEPDRILIVCTAELEATAPPPGQTPQHFSVVPFAAKFERIMIEINSLQPWGDIVFVDGFESGDLTQRSSVNQ